jgi:hypothetical protein
MPTFNPAPISGLTPLAKPTANDIIPVYDPEEVNAQHKTKGIKYSDFIPLGLEELADPNAQRVLYWNDTTNKLEWLTLPADMSIEGGVLKQKHMLYNTIIPNGTAISPRVGKMTITDELDGYTLANVYLTSYAPVTSAVSVSVKKNGSTAVTTASIASGAKTGSAAGNSTTFASTDEVWIDCTAGGGGDGLDVVLVFKK